MSKHRYTVQEVVALINDDDDLVNLHAGDLDDTESDDGDVEEADYISTTGNTELVTPCCYWTLFSLIFVSGHKKKFRMELAYALTGPVVASHIGQGRTPTDPTLDRLKGKHFAYYHERRGRCVVCAYKRQTTNCKKRKDTKKRITVLNVMYMYAMVSVLKNTIH